MIRSAIAGMLTVVGLVAIVVAELLSPSGPECPHCGGTMAGSYECHRCGRVRS